MSIRRRFDEAINAYITLHGKSPKTMQTPPELGMQLELALKVELLFRGTWLNGVYHFRGVQLIPNDEVTDLVAGE